MIAVSTHKRPRPYFPLKEILKHRGRSQYSLARELRMSTTYLSRLATGKQLPGWRVVCLIADALELNLGDLQFPGPGAAGGRRMP